MSEENLMNVNGNNTTTKGTRTKSDWCDVVPVSQVCQEVFEKFGTYKITSHQITIYTNVYHHRIPTAFKNLIKMENETPQKWDFEIGADGSYDGQFPSHQYRVEKPQEMNLAVVNTVNVETVIDWTKYIPEISSCFSSFGPNWKLIDNIVKTKIFFPLYIWGISGLGKTFQIEQACAIHKRPYFRAQITKDTTNEDLIGSYSLVNGNTVWVDGPVLMAYKSGGVLLLDEIDLNPSLMILQGVLENKALLIPQTGELVRPEEGFTVFATGNTKGDGNDSRYVGTSVMNEAFMERFVSVVEQEIPSISVEEKIIKKYCSVNSIELEENTLGTFLKWIELVRKNYVDGNTEIYISTRRIQYVLKIFAMVKNFGKSLELALARYGSEEKDGLLKVWKAME